VTSKEIVAELRRLGYTGPVSYGKARLLELLFETTAGRTDTAGSAEAVEPATEAPEQPAAASPNETMAIPQAKTSGHSKDEWHGLKKDDFVHVAGYPGWRFKFQSYEEPPGCKPYVVVKATQRRKIKMRYFRPEQICHPKTKKPLIQENI